ncbi:MAG: 50S ribosomal protein L25 [Alicyclobacillaceae bacterium]|nr:50S ribosomal protein L25 [Alicyclobacillaceae bacterium]
MGSQVLPLELRPDLRRSVLTRLRGQGRIPGIVYGKGRQPTPVSVEEKRLTRLQTGKGVTLVDIEVPGQGRFPAVLQEVQRDPVTQKILHVDFHVVSLDEPVDVEVPVIVVGLEEVEKRGLVVQLQLRQIEVRCLPTRIPEHLTVDITGAQDGDVVRAGDVTLPEGAVLLSDADEVLLNVTESGAEAGEGELPTEAQEPELAQDAAGKGRQEE